MNQNLEFSIINFEDMADQNNILEKLNGLESRYEEISTLITDPEVIANQERFVKLTREYKELGDIMDARKRYISCINSIKEAKIYWQTKVMPKLRNWHVRN